MALSLGSAVAYLELDTSKFTKGFSSALNDLKVFQSKSATAEKKIKGLSSAMATTGSVITKSVTLPLLAVGTASTKVATDFESGMSEVKAISGATGKDFDDLKNKAIEMGAKTKFSATESAEAFKYMAMAGWDTTDMLNSIDGVMSLAAASGEDLATVSDIVTDSMTAFGLSASGTSKVLKDGLEIEVSNATRYVDVLAKASSSSNTNVSLMGETFKYVAPVAGALGYSVEDCAVAIGVMANSGIKGTQAGTTLRSTLTRLAKPTDTVETAMKKYNISLTDAQENMKPLSELMVDLRDRFNGLSEAEKASLAATLAGQEGMSGLLAIVNAGEDDFQNLTNEINNASGASQEMADIMLDNTAGAVTILKSSLESAGIVIGEKLAPYIRKLAEWITSLIERFNNLSEEQQDFIVRLGLVIAAIGPALLIGSKVLGLFVSMINAIKNIKEALFILKDVITGISAPVYIAIGVIALLIEAFKTLWETNEDFKTNIIGIWKVLVARIKEFSQSFVDKINELGFDFKDITELMSAAWEGFCKILEPLFTGVFVSIVNLIGNMLNVILGLVDIFVSAVNGDFDGLKKAISDTVMGIIKIVSDLFADLLETILDIVANIVKAFGFEEASENIRNFADKTREVIKGIPDTIQSFIDKIEEFSNDVSNFVNDVIQFFSDMWEGVVNGANSVIDFFTVTIPETFNKFINETVPNFIQSIITWFENLPYNIGVIVGKILGHIYLWGTEIKNWAETEIPNFIDKVIDFFMELPGKIWEWLVKALDNVIKWGKELITNGKQSASNFLDNVIKFLSQLPGKVYNYLKTTLTNVITWAKEMKSKAIQSGTEFVNSFIDFIKTLPEKVWGIIKQIPDKVKQIGDSLKEAGKAIFNKLLNGIKSVGDSILSWVRDFAGNIGNFISGIISGFSSVVSSANSAKSAAKSVSGSHANGLDYVPYNGYIAELHEGERVLTKQENRDYNRNRNNGGGDVFNFYNTKPDPYEYARQMKRAKAELLRG